MALGSRFRGKSFGEILELCKGAGMGFDLLRLGLSVLILLSHASGITEHRGTTNAILHWLFHVHTPAAAPAMIPAKTAIATGTPIPGLHGPGRPFTLSHVPMFFALSGFLVAGSAFRVRNVFRFLGLRVLRILPALFVEVTLSAIILGGVFTTLPLTDYYSSHGFWSYFLNIVGDIHYKLPGVFVDTSGSSNVNSNLWTLPGEFDCYLILSALMVTGLVFKRGIYLACWVIGTIILLIANAFYGYQITDAQLGNSVNVYYFLTGLLFFLFRDKIVFHEIVFVLAIIFAYPLMMFKNTVYLYPVALTYITVFIGLFPFPQFKLLKTGDYSYGIYLYGYPVTQALVAAFPAVKGSLTLAALAATALTALFAAFSWHAVEKHALKLKRYLSKRSAKISEELHPDALAIDGGVAASGPGGTVEAGSKP